MSDLEFRIVFLSLFCLIVIIFNWYVIKNPNFVDKPLDGWLGRTTNAQGMHQEQRLKHYRKMAKRNFIVIGILLLLLIKDIWTYISS